MRFGTRAVGVAACAVLVASATPASAQPRQDQPQAGLAAAAPAAPRTVTLVTGDKVTVTDDRSAPTVTPAPGREGVLFNTREIDGHWHVRPGDAASALAAGTLDPRLFDVTQLLDYGYDDAARDSLPLIVPSAASAAASGVQFGSLGLAAVAPKKADLPAQWPALRGAPGKVWLDGKVKVTLDKTAAQIGAPIAWQAGITGEGVKVAVLDTGVDGEHPAMKGQVIASKNFSPSPTDKDKFGHGTHVASTIVSTDSKYRGVAYGAKILAGKVLGDGGNGPDSGVLAGMQWAVEQGAKVVNLSLGSSDGYGQDILETAVEELSAKHGTLFVIAAGNEGKTTGAINSPGSAKSALTVGAVDADDQISSFSSRGPANDGTPKPEITAPGSLTAAWSTDAGGPGWTYNEGTSMATPHVAGVAALLAQQHPDWTGQRIKSQIVASARATKDAGVFDQGAGRVDVGKALAQTVYAAPAAIGFDTQQWPHDDDTSTSKDVTYRNDSAQPVTLNLSVDAATGPGDKPASGVFTVSPATLTVPAGGTAKATVAADTRKATTDGYYGAQVLATAGDIAVRTPVTVNREVESYNLKVTVIGPDGKPTPNYDLTLTSPAHSDRNSTSPGGVTTIRAPKGTYFMEVNLTTDKAYVLTQPVVALTKDTTITLDARKAKVVNQRVTDPTATYASGRFHSLYLHERIRAWNIFNDPNGRVYTAQFGPTRDDETYASMSQAEWRSPTAVYNLTANRKGAILDDLDRSYAAKDLAKLEARVDGTGSAVRLDTVNRLQNYLFVDYPVKGHETKDLPATLTQYVAPDPYGYEMRVVRTAKDTGATLATTIAANVPATAGRTTVRHFNRPIFAPGGGGAVVDIWRGGVDYPAMVSFEPRLFGGPGTSGTSDYDTGVTNFYLNGVKKGSIPKVVPTYAWVPNQNARIRWESSADRSTKYPTSTKVTAAWEFDYIAKPDLGSIPDVPTVRLSAPVDANGTAAASTRFVIPVTLETQGNHTLATTLQAEVSYDEGQTWTKATTIDNAAIVLTHPAKGSVSLRATATNRAGAKSEVTVIKAYTLR